LLVYWFGMYCMNFPLKNSMVVLLLCFFWCYTP
jgi:hypothetical protein